MDNEKIRSCKWCAKLIRDIPKKELYDNCLCSEKCKQEGFSIN